MGKNSKIIARKIRHRRIRAKIRGTAQIPRLNIFRSLKNIYVQLINDEEGKTVIGVSTLSREFREKAKYGGNVKAAEILGEIIAEKAINSRIEQVVFDRGGYKYHGRVKSLAESARTKGLKF